MALKAGRYGVTKAQLEALKGGGGGSVKINSIGDGLNLSESGELSAINQIVDYSTTEVNTRKKWIDGKNIYQKVITGDTLPVNNSVLVSNVDFCINAYGAQLYDEGGTNERWYNFPYISNLRWELRTNSHQITILNTSGGQGTKFKWIFEYTKIEEDYKNGI